MGLSTPVRWLCIGLAAEVVAGSTRSLVRSEADSGIAVAVTAAEMDEDKQVNTSVLDFGGEDEQEQDALRGLEMSTNLNWRRRRVVRGNMVFAIHNKAFNRFVSMNSKGKLTTSNPMSAMSLPDSHRWERFKAVPARRRRQGEFNLYNTYHGRFVWLKHGRMGATTKRKSLPGGWRAERWYPVEKKGGYIAFYVDVYKRYMRMQKTHMDASDVITKTHKDSASELFSLVEETFQLTTGDIVAFYCPLFKRFLSLKATFVGASPPTDFNAIPVTWTSEQWKVVDAGNGEVALHNGKHNRFLKLGSGGASPPRKETELPSSWKGERFAVITVASGEVGLFNDLTKKYIQLTPKGKLSASAKTTAESFNRNWQWERFKIFKMYDAVTGAAYLNLKGKKATQSSTGWGGVASRCIDNNPATQYAKKSCSHTLRTKNPWWQVDLGAKYKIFKVRVTNRADGASGWRLNGFNIYVDGKLCATNVRIKPGETVAADCKATGKVVRILIPRTQYLNMCEVGVMALKA